MQQVFVAVLFNLVVGVAGNAERVVLDDFHAGEKHRKEGRDQLLHWQVPDYRAVRRSPAALIEFDEAVDVVGHLDPGEVLCAVVGLPDRDRQVQAQPADERERVRRVDGERRQHGEDLLGEIGRQYVALGLIEIGPGDDVDALLGQRRAHRVEEHAGVPGGDPLRLLADAGQLLARRQAVGRADRQSHLVAALQAGDPNHVELVEVGCEDREELGSLQQRQRFVVGKRQDACVEVQPAQFAVEVAVLWEWVVDRGGSRGRGCRHVRVAWLPHSFFGARLSFDFGHHGIIAHHPLVLLAHDGRQSAVGVPFTLSTGIEPPVGRG